MTRHRDGAQLYAGRDEFSDMDALTARLSRSQAKETTLDYEQAAYARRRGFKSEIIIPQPAHERAADRQVERPTWARSTGRVMQGEAQRDAFSGVTKDAIPEEAIASGRAGFRERYEANKRQQAFEAARDAQARGLVREWGELTAAYNKALPGLEIDPTLGGARARLARFGDALQAYPDAAQALRERGPAFGVEKDSNLARVLADPQPVRAITGLMDIVEKNMRHDLKLAAERTAAQELERSLSRSRNRGMTLG